MFGTKIKIDRDREINGVVNDERIAVNAAVHFREFCDSNTECTRDKR